MARKGTQYHCPAKRVQIPADVRALGASGTHIIQAINSYWSKLRSDARKHDGQKVV